MTGPDAGFRRILEEGILAGRPVTDAERLDFAYVSTKLNVPFHDLAAGRVYPGRGAPCFCCGLSDQQRRDLFSTASWRGSTPCSCPFHQPEPMMLEAGPDSTVEELLDRAAGLAEGSPALLPDWGISAEARCLECARKWSPMRRTPGPCPHCGSRRVQDHEKITRVGRDSHWVRRTIAELGLPRDHLHTIRFEGRFEGRTDPRLDAEWDAMPAPVRRRGRRPLCDGECFDVVLGQAGGIIGWKQGEPVLAASHDVTFRFPRFFPLVPIEAKFAIPLFHPSVDPFNGEVWLGTDSIAEAVERVRAIVSEPGRG